MFFQVRNVRTSHITMRPCLAAQGDWPQGDSPSVKTSDGGAGWKKTDVKHDQMDLKTGRKETLFLWWTTDYHSFVQHPQCLWLSRSVLCSGHLPGAQRRWYFSQDVQGWCAWLIGEHFWCTRELHLMRSPHNLDFWGDFATYLSWFSELFDRIALFPWYYKFSPASCVKSFGSKHVSLTYQASSLVSEGEGATVSYIPKAIFYGR